MLVKVRQAIAWCSAMLLLGAGLSFSAPPAAASGVRLGGRRACRPQWML